MQVPMFYSTKTMAVHQWLDMLADTEQRGEGITHIYELQASEHFLLNGDIQESGVYYLRASADQIQNREAACKVRKLSFPEIVHLSDIFSLFVVSTMQRDLDLKKAAQIGDASRSIEKGIASTTGLENMREKVWTKYYGKGLMGIVRRFLSAIANFFRKYNFYIETGILWPGNSCTYADKVIHQFYRIKKPFVEVALVESQLQLSEYLGVSLEEMEKMKTEELKKLYRKEVYKFHPDKTGNDVQAGKQFTKINQVWGDFYELTKLKTKMDRELRFERGSDFPEEKNFLNDVD